MEDFARLVMEVDTSPMERASTVADSFANSADRAGASAERISSSMASSAGAAKMLEDAVLRAKLRYREIEDEADRAARATEEQARAARQAASELKAMQASADSLRGALDPLWAAQQRHNKEVERYAELRKAELIDQDMLVQAQQRSAKVLADTEEQLKGTGNAFGLAGQQVSNLRYQLIDIGTMAAMGSPVLMIVASQAGQIYQALGDNGGVMKSIRGIGQGFVDLGKSAAAFMGPWGMAMAGAAVAVTAVGYAFSKSIVPLDDKLKAQTKNVQSLEQAYGLAGDRAEEYGRRAAGAVSAITKTSTESLQKDVLNNVAAQRQDMMGSLGGLFGNQDDVVELRRRVDEFYESVESGNPRLRQFDEYLAEVVGESKNRGLVRLAKDWLTFNETIAASVGQMTRAEEMLDKFTRRAQLASQRLAGLKEEMADLLPDDTSQNEDIERIYRLRMDAINDSNASPRAKEGARMEADRDRAAALRELNRQSLNDLMDAEDRRLDITRSSADRQIAEINRRYDAELTRMREIDANDPRIKTVEATRDNETSAVREQALRDAEFERQSNALDVRAITARTAAQQANLAAERALLEARRANKTEAEQQAAADQARALSMGQANESLAESQRRLNDSTNRQIDQMKLEAQLVGASVGEAARLRAEFDLLAQAKDMARSAGFDESTVELTQAMKDQAAAIGEATAAMEELNFQREIRFRTEQAGRSPEEQDIAAELRSMGLEYESQEGKKRAAILRTVNATELAAEKMRDLREAGRDAFLDLIQNIGRTDDLLGDIASSFAGLGAQLTSMGLDKIMKSFGGGGGGTASIGTTATQLASTAGAHVTTLGGSRAPAVSAPMSSPSYPGADKYVLPEVKGTSRALSGFSAELTAAAKAIRTIESGSAGGNYTAKGPVTDSGDRAYGAYQVMGNNIPSWSKAAIGRVVSNVEFLGSKDIQDAVFKHRFGGYMDKYGAEGASRAWFAGEGGMRNYKAQDVVGTSVSGYGSRFGQLYQGHLGDGPERTGGSALLGSEYQAKKVLVEGTAEGTRIGIQDASGEGTPGAASSGQQPMGLGQQAIAGVAGLAGLFGQGYQSGSPLGGGLSGGLGGFQLGSSLSFLGSAGGPIGAVVGAAAGILGGVLGGRKQRAQEHRQKAEAWEQMRPQYEAFDASLSGEGQGGLRKYITEQWSQLSAFMKTGGDAWKNGTGNSTAQFRSTGQKLFDGFGKMIAEFQEGYVAMIEDLEAGDGLQGAFARGRAATKDLKKQIQDTRDDVEIAFGDVASISFLNTPDAAAQAKATEEMRANAVDRYNRAAAQHALALLYNDKVTSDVTKTIDGLRGTAAGLHDVFKDLGYSAEEAATAIHTRLDQALGNVAQTLNESIRDRIEELAGVGYFGAVRDFLEDFETLRSDVAAAGSDTSGLNDLFGREAQAIVDGAEVTGSAFQELIKMFPQLSGVVHEASDAIARTSKEIEDLKLSYADREFEAGLDTTTLAGSLSRFDRYANREREEEARAGGQALAELERALSAERLQVVRQFREQENQVNQQALDDARSYLVSFRRDIDEYLDGLSAGADSPLSNKGRLAEARTQFDTQLRLAQNGDRDALDSITSYADRLLSASKNYNASSPAYQADYAMVRKLLDALPSQVTAEEIVADAVRKGAADTVAAIRQNAVDLARDLAGNFGGSDTDGSGGISVQEFLKAMEGKATDEELRRIHAELDLNGDAQVSKLESLLAADGTTRSALIAALASGAQSTANLTGQALAGSFSVLDRSVNGLLDAGELKLAIGGLATDAQLAALLTEMDLNGDAQVSKLEALLAADGLTRTTLKNAFESGGGGGGGGGASASAIGEALAPHFSKLDSSVNGLLDYSEMRAALSGIATDSQIRTMMQVLDTNGDGQISYLEAINSKNANQIGYLDSINRLTSLVHQIGTNQYNITEAMRHNQANQLERIRANLAAANGRVGAPQYRTGGFTGFGGVDQYAGDVHGQEYVLDEQTTRSIGVNTLDAIRRNRRLPMMMAPGVGRGGGGDDARLARIEAAVDRMSDRNVEATVAAAERIVAPLGSLTRTSEREIRQSRRARRTQKENA